MKFLFCSLSNRGFLHPCMGLALELEKRGHSTGFVSDQGISNELACSGLIQLSCGGTEDRCFDIGLWHQPLAAVLQLKHIESAVRMFQPDVMISQPLLLGALLAKERLGIPLAQVGFATYLWPVELPAHLKISRETAQRKLWRRSEMLRLYNQARAMIRLESVSGESEAPFLGDLFLLRSVPELEYDFEYLPDRVHLAGSCLWENGLSDPALEAWLDNHREQANPLIYVQHGRSFQGPHFWSSMVEALSKLDVQVAAATERTDCPVNSVPPNFFLRPYIPQGRILDQAQAVVASGNSTAVLGALAAAVPALLIPSGGEQPDVAERVAESGAAQILQSNEATPERLCLEIKLLQKDQRMQRACQRISKSLKKLNSFEFAADLLELLAATKKPVLRGSVPASLQCGKSSQTQCSDHGYMD